MNLIFKEATRPWTPDILRGSSSGLAAWYDAADAKSVVLNGTNVSQWNDKSGNERHATQATADNQPAYTIDGLNGKGCLTWPNSISSKTLITPSFAASDFMFVVRYHNGTQATWITSYQAVFGGVTTSNIGALANTSGSSTWYGFAVLYDTARLNGSAEYTFHGSTALPLNTSILHCSKSGTTTDQWVLGSDRNLIARAWSGVIAEIIAGSLAFNSTTRKKIEGYLAWKWGIQESLPTDHPYRYHRPMR